MKDTAEGWLQKQLTSVEAPQRIAREACTKLTTLHGRVRAMEVRVGGNYFAGHDQPSTAS